MFAEVGDRAECVIRSVPIPEPGRREVRFRVAASALNQADLLLTQGRHFAKAELPIRLGHEGCGTDAVGPVVTRFRPGDRVTCIPLSMARTQPAALRSPTKAF